MKIFQNTIISIVFGLCFIYSCEKEELYDLTKLPPDTGGEHIPFTKAQTDAIYGYYIYLPSGYRNTNMKYPLLIMLHGGNGVWDSARTAENIDQVLVYGPSMMIENGTWAPPHPMIVVSPHSYELRWDHEKVHEFIAYIMHHYRVNERRVYLTGASLGGFGTFSYLQTYSHNGYVTAGIPICGGADVSKADKLLDIPLWVFHGSNDNIILTHRSVDIVNAINALNPSLKARLTIFSGVGHASWTYAYEGTGRGLESPAYDPLDMSIYEWLLQYEK